MFNVIKLVTIMDMVSETKKIADYANGLWTPELTAAITMVQFNQPSAILSMQPLL